MINNKQSSINTGSCVSFYAIIVQGKQYIWGNRRCFGKICEEDLI